LFQLRSDFLSAKTINIFSMTSIASCQNRKRKNCVNFNLEIINRFDWFSIKLLSAVRRL
jgi:hypothetical protein